MKFHIALFVLSVIAVSSYNAEQAKDEKDIGVVIGIDLGTTYSW